MIVVAFFCVCSSKTDVSLLSAHHPASWGRWTALNTVVLVGRRRPAVVVRAPIECPATSAPTLLPISSHRIFHRRTACRSLLDRVQRRLASTLHHILTTITPWPQPGLVTIRIRVWQPPQVRTTPRRTTIITRSRNSTSPIGINCSPASTHSPAAFSVASSLPVQTPARKRFNTSNAVI